MEILVPFFEQLFTGILILASILAVLFAGQELFRRIYHIFVISIPPSKVYVLQGREKYIDPENGQSIIRDYRIVQGKAVFYPPWGKILGIYDLSNRTIEVSVEGVSSKDMLAINMDVAAVVKISSDPVLLIDVIEQYGDKKDDEINLMIKDVIEGRLNNLINGMDVLDIINQEKELDKHVQSVISDRLTSLGVTMIAFSLKTLNDRDGVIEDVQKEARQKKIDRIEKERKEAEAEKKKTYEKIDNDERAFLEELKTQEAQHKAEQAVIQVAAEEKEDIERKEADSRKRDRELEQNKRSRERDVELQKAQDELRKQESISKKEAIEEERTVIHEQEKNNRETKVMQEETTLMLEIAKIENQSKIAEEEKQKEIRLLDLQRKDEQSRALAQIEKKKIELQGEESLNAEKIRLQQAQLEAKTALEEQSAEAKMGVALKVRELEAVEAENRLAQARNEAEWKNVEQSAAAEREKIQAAAIAAINEQEAENSIAAFKAKELAREEVRKEHIRSLLELDSNAQKILWLETLLPELPAILEKGLGPDGLALPKVFEAIAKPLEKVGDIRIVDMGGAGSNGSTPPLQKLVDTVPELIARNWTRFQQVREALDMPALKEMLQLSNNTSGLDEEAQEKLAGMLELFDAITNQNCENGNFGEASGSSADGLQITNGKNHDEEAKK